MSHVNQQESPEKSIWGYKGVILGVLFFGLFILGLFKAMSNEPDYMPSQQVKRKQEALLQQQTQQKNEASTQQSTTVKP